MKDPGLANSAEPMDYGFETYDFCLFWRKTKVLKLSPGAIHADHPGSKFRVSLSGDFRSSFKLLMFAVQMSGVSVMRRYFSYSCG